MSQTDVEKQPITDILPKLQDWLLTCPGMIAVRQVVVIIGSNSYQGCCYHQLSSIDHEVKRFYLLGVLKFKGRKPTTTLQNFSKVKPIPANSVFHWEGQKKHSFFDIEPAETVVNTSDWFVAGYFFDSATSHHPFGPNFCITEWTRREPIDLHDKHKYKSIPMSVSFLSRWKKGTSKPGVVLGH